MSTRDISQFDREDADLRADIRRMGDMLGETLRNLWGEELYEFVEYVRLSTRALRESPNHELREQLFKKLEESQLWHVIRTVRCLH